MENLKEQIDTLKEYKEKISKLSTDEKKDRDIYLRELSDGTLQGPPTGYSSIDKTWFKYYDKDKLRLDVPKKSMYQYFVDSVSDKLDSVAVDLRMSFNNFDKSMCTMTYGQVIDQIVTIACGLKSYGVDENDILLEMLPNLIESRNSIYAASAIGSTVYPISPMIPTTKFREILETEKIKNVVMFSDFYNKFKDYLNDESIEHIIYLDGTESFNPIIRKIAKLTDKENKFKIPSDDRIVTWDKVLKAGKKYRRKNKIKSYKDFESYYDENHIAVIEGTSGTTGVPKGACLTDDAVNAMAFINGKFNEFNSGEKNLDVLIQSISYGIGIMHLSMSCGLNNILVPELITDKIAMLLKKFKPEHFSGGPIHYENILKSEEFKNGELYKPKNFLSGGASLNKETEKTLNGGIDENYIEPKDGPTKVFVRQGLGSTENIGTGVFSTKGSYKFASVGIPIGLSNCAIFKVGTDEEVKTGEIGEICMTGPTVMEKYLNNPIETEKVLKKHSDGTVWLHLGDEGYMDKDGHVFMLDRYKNIFMRNGFNVHPSKIKEVLMSSGDLLDCAVVGVDHPVEMSVPVAFIVLKPGIDYDTEIDKLNKLCYEQLDEYYIPYEYKSVKEIPTNLGGKADINKLLEMNNIDYSESTESKVNLR
ncbi:MAG: AMP-binding protein [Bacilli bacterium]|nr:AMP-binding protein [Bacilli bacterium]